MNWFGTRIEFDMAGMPHRVPPETSGVAESETTIKPPAMAVRTEVEDGRRMLIAAVSRDGKPLEGVRVAFSAEVESVLQPIGEDATVDDGTAAVPFPEGIPGGPKGELRIVAETRTPAEGAGTRSEGVFLGGIPVTAAAWRPDSLGTRIWVTATLAAGVLAASLMYLFARSRRAGEGTRT